MILASIILFNPDLARLEENILSVEDQTDRILCIDNGSSNISAVRELLTGHGCLLIENKGNYGIAKALNQAMHYADKNKFEWVLTLDQDTVCPADLMKILKKHTDKERVAIIAPEYQDRNVNRIFSKETNWKYVNRCITSASLTNTKIWKILGGYNEKLFIDFVDYDFCARIIRNGFAIIQDSNAVILHEIGHSTRLFLGKHAFVLFNHDPKRDYYYVRNGLYYCAEYPDVWNTAQQKKDILIRCFLIVIFEKNRFRKLASILKGWADSGKMIKESKKIKKDSISRSNREVYQSEHAGKKD